MKNNTTLYYLLAGLVVFSFLIVSCAKETDIITEDPSTIGFPNPTEAISASIFGRVIDKDNNPIVGAEVICLSCIEAKTLQTDSTGNFLFKDIQNKGTTAFLSLNSPNMFKAFRRFPLLPDRYNYTEVLMNERVSFGIITSKTGGTIEDNNGATVTLPANGIVDNNGQIYTGPVEVFMAWVNPSADNLAQNIIGDLSGVDSEGILQSLTTFGMLVIELRDENGNELNLLEGHEAELRFPVPSDLIATAPDEIPLWYYDETNGYWVEESVAYLEGEFYVGTVTHFSSWNVDTKEEGINVSGVVTIQNDANRLPASYYEIFVCRPNIGEIGGWLCDDGSFLFYNFPVGEEFTLKIKDYCGNLVYEGVHGPFSDDTVMDPIALELSSTIQALTVTGNALDCAADIVDNGLVVLEVGSKKYIQDVELDGSFEIHATVCENFNASLYIINRDDLNISNTIQLTNLDTSFDYKDVVVCEEYDNYFYLNIEGYSEVLKYHNDSATGTDLSFGVLQIPNNFPFFYIPADGSGLNPTSLKFDLDLIIVDQIVKGTDELIASLTIQDQNGNWVTEKGTMENIHYLFTDFEYETVNNLLVEIVAVGQMYGYILNADGDRFDINASFKFKI